MAIDFRNPIGYLDSRFLRNSPRDECDGMCEKCSRSRDCIFARTHEMTHSKYSDNNELDLRLIDVELNNRSHRYAPRSERDFSNPMRDYSVGKGDYRYDGFRGENGNNSRAGGFHGSYSGGDDYSSMNPKSGKSN